MRGESALTVSGFDGEEAEATARLMFLPGPRCRGSVILSGLGLQSETWSLTMQVHKRLGLVDQGVIDRYDSAIKAQSQVLSTRPTSLSERGLIEPDAQNVDAQRRDGLSLKNLAADIAEQGAKARDLVVEQ